MSAKADRTARVSRGSQLVEIGEPGSPEAAPKSSRYMIVVHCAIPLLIFALFFNLNILNPTRVGWLLDGDWGQHFLGWHAFRQAPFKWPFNHEDLLANPTGLSLIYTDSNPLLAFPLRLFSGGLPRYFQYIGPWFLACVVLNYAIACIWLRKYAPGPWAAAAGAALLTLLPTLFNRIGHDTLCAHWLILWTLYIFFEVRDERRKLVLYGADLFITGLVHPYILFMNLAVWAADQMRRVFPLLKRRAWRDAARGGGEAVLSLAPMVAALALAGAFSGQSAGSDGFGVYGMPLDALFNPGRDDFALAFLKGPQPPMMQFEGFQYLGFGLLALIGCVVWLYYRHPEMRGGTPLLTMARPLKWPFIILTIIAVTDHVFLYRIKLLDLSFPGPVVDVLNVVRASGRVFWPVAYCLVFLAVAYAFRAPERWRRGLLGVALLLQLIDLNGFAQSIRGLTARAADPADFHVATSPQWDAVMAASDRVVFVAPVLGREHRPFYEVVLHALDRQRPINMMYAARENPVQTALQRAEYFDFMAGKTDPRQLYVLLNKSVPESLAGRVRQIDGVWVIPPQAGAGLVTASPVRPPLRLDTDYEVGYDTPTGAWFGPEWAVPGDGSMGSVSERAGFTMPYIQPAGQALSLSLTVRGRRKGQHIRFYSGGRLVGDEPVGKSSRTVTIVLPAPRMATPVAVTLVGVTTAKDRSQGRTAGIQLYSLRLSQAFVDGVRKAAAGA